MSEKFSQFSTESDLSQITGVAGYITGSPGTNVRISGADIDSSILRPGSGDVDINPTSGKIQLKQPNLQYNGTGSQTYIRSSNLPDFYHLMPDSNVYFNLYNGSLAPNGKSFIGWIGGSVQFITGHPTNATHGGNILLTSKGSTATLQTFNAANWGDQTGDIDPGGVVTISSAAENINLNTRAIGSIKVGRDLIGSVTQNFSGANDEPYTQRIPGVTAGVSTSGSGTGLVLEMNVSGGVATRIRVSNATSNSQSGWNNCQGEGFQAGDTITFSSGTFGGTQDLIITLTAADVEMAQVTVPNKIQFQGYVADSDGDTGTLGQVLTIDSDGFTDWQTPSAGGGLTPTTQTTNYTAAASDFVICNVTTSLRVTLPAASAGAIVGIKYASQSAPTDVCDILTPSAGVTIDGTDRSSTALVLPSLNTYYELISDGTNWFIK